MQKRDLAIASSIALATVIALANPALAQMNTTKSTADQATVHNAPALNSSTTSIAPTNSTIDASQFKAAMRDLWMDHIVYTRLVIISFAHNLPDYNATADRLLQNQVEIGNAIKPYYGNTSGNQMTALLKQHILTAVDVLKAAKANDTQALATANATWYANADQIAAFLSNATGLPKQSVISMMDNHLALTTQEAVARIHGNYTADITAFDNVHKEILMMSDSIADTIIKQFPDRFTGATQTSAITTNATKTAAANTTTSTVNVSIVPNAPSMDNKAFQPNPISIKAGTTVVWTNNDSIPHTVTSGLSANSNSGKLFDSETIAPGHTFKHTFSTPGQFSYHCEIHPQMTGQVNVT